MKASKPQTRPAGTKLSIHAWADGVKPAAPLINLEELRAVAEWAAPLLFGIPPARWGEALGAIIEARQPFVDPAQLAIDRQQPQLRIQRVIHTLTTLLDFVQAMSGGGARA